MYSKGYIEVDKSKEPPKFATNAIRQSAAPYDPHENVLGLTREGHKYHRELDVEISTGQLRQEQEKRDRMRFRYDTIAVIVSIGALVISGLVLVISGLALAISGLAFLLD